MFNMLQAFLDIRKGSFFATFSELKDCDSCNGVCLKFLKRVRHPGVGKKLIVPVLNSLHISRIKQYLILVASLILISSPASSQSTSDALRVICHVAMPWVIGNQVAETLIYVDNDNNFIPNLAATYTMHQKYMDMKLRQGIVFHDGTPFTAASVIMNWQAYKKTARPYFTIDLRQGVKDIEELSPHDVRIWFKEDGLIGLIPVFLRSFYLYSPSYFAHFKGKYPSGNQANMLVPGKWGTGAYILKEVQEKGAVAILEKNPNYWQEGLPKTEKIILNGPKKYDGLTAHRLMKEGKADLFDAVSPSMLPIMHQSDAVSLIFKHPLSCLTTLFNMRKADSPLRDIRVRKALNLLIDRRTLFKYLTRGRALMTSFIFPLATSGHDLEPYPYRPDEAKNLLKIAGFTGEKPLQLSIGYFMSEKKLAHAIAAMLEEGGVKIEFREYQTRYQWYKRFLQALHSDENPMESETWDLNIVNIGLYTNSAATHFGESFSTQGGYRWILPDPRADEMFLSAARQKGLQNVEANLLQLEKYLYERYYIMPIYITPTILAVSKRIEKSSFSASGYLLNMKEIGIE